MKLKISTQNKVLKRKPLFGSHIKDFKMKVFKRITLKLSVDYLLSTRRLSD